MAEAFYRETGMMAPGKDVPAAMGGPDFATRQKAWERWLKGPAPQPAREPSETAIEAAHSLVVELREAITAYVVAKGAPRFPKEVVNESTLSAWARLDALLLRVEQELQRQAGSGASRGEVGRTPAASPAECPVRRFAQDLVETYRAHGGDFYFTEDHYQRAFGSLATPCPAPRAAEPEEG